MDNPVIYVFSDGGCRNTGNKLGQHVKHNNKAAWAYMLRFNRYPNKYVSNSKAYYGKTNNQMELSGVIFALNSMLINLPVSIIKRARFVFVLDSKYVINGIQKWFPKWNSNWTKHTPNGKYWNLLFTLLKVYGHYKCHWVRGHQEKKKDFYHCGNCFVDHLLNHSMDKLKSK